MNWGDLMNYVIIDLEFNNLQDITHYYPNFYEDNQDALKNECPNEIIEIGAVKLDKLLKPIDYFKLYIKSNIYNILNPRITEITGITEENLKEGTNFTEAIEKLGVFVGQDAVICSWAKDDVAELIRNANYYNYKNIDWLKEYLDIQEYCTKVLAEKNSLSLKHALERLNVKVNEEELHDALNDAIYTLEVFKRVFNSRIVKNYIINDIINMPSIVIRDFGNFRIDESQTEFYCPKCNSDVRIDYPLRLFGWKFISIGCCKRCNNKILQKIVVKQNLAGDKVYNNNRRILTEEEYGDYCYKYENNKLIL